MEIAETAYRKLSVRAFHSDELKQALLEKGFDLCDIEPLIEKLADQGYLNDNEWLEGFARKCVRKGWGRNEVLQKLKVKRVKNSDIDVVLEYVGQHEVEMIERHLCNKDLSDEKVKRRVINSLYRKGFSLDNIRQASIDF